MISSKYFIHHLIFPLPMFQVLKKATNAGAGMINKGLKAVNSTHIGMYSQNRVEVSGAEEYNRVPTAQGKQGKQGKW